MLFDAFQCSWPLTYRVVMCGISCPCWLQRPGACTKHNCFGGRKNFAKHRRKAECFIRWEDVRSSVRSKTLFTSSFHGWNGQVSQAFRSQACPCASILHWQFLCAQLLWSQPGFLILPCEQKNQLILFVCQFPGSRSRGTVTVVTGWRLCSSVFSCWWTPPSTWRTTWAQWWFDHETE